VLSKGQNRIYLAVNTASTGIVWVDWSTYPSHYAAVAEVNGTDCQGDWKKQSHRKEDVIYV